MKTPFLYKVKHDHVMIDGRIMPIAHAELSDELYAAPEAILLLLSKFYLLPIKTSSLLVSVPVSLVIASRSSLQVSNRCSNAAGTSLNALDALGNPILIPGSQECFDFAASQPALTEVKFRRTIDRDGSSIIS
ncbi:hypothetical protein EDD22DRAFT_853414 [Suillus occidentalis]|nr:hypothetical protein EDD22DRAFT_853414 [Suillus occidentalis]